MRKTLIGVAFILALIPGAALPANDQLRASVLKELKIIHPEAAEADLTDEQIRRIHLILHGPYSQGKKVARIDSVLGNCLFGCLTFGTGSN